ncbi:MAG TPA: hypothetical protein VJL87_07165 [Bdellovibrionota bacterium]|nr:hypothetical protein [Bdellovibrionota bacterium]
MKWNTSLIVFFLILLVSSFSFADGVNREDSMLWEKHGDRLFLASMDGLDLFNLDLVKMNSAKGPGHLPVEVEVISNEDAFVLTKKSLDYYNFDRHDRLWLVDSIKLRRTDPVDLEFLNLAKGLLLVVYRDGFETFTANFGKKALYQNSVTE